MISDLNPKRVIQETQKLLDKLTVARERSSIHRGSIQCDDPDEDTNPRNPSGKDGRE